MKNLYIERKNLGYIKEVVFTGGVAKNIGIEAALERLIGIKMIVPEEAQIVGALGVALIAQEALKHS